MNKQLELIQGSRAIVPILVALIHIVGTMNAKYEYNFLGLSGLTKSGGVDYFFVLTGFMIFYVYNQKFNQENYYKVFIINRLMRIYPFYWLITLPIIFLFYFVPSFNTGNEESLLYLIKSLLLITQAEGPYLYVAWSLSFNVMFYLVFAYFLKFQVRIFEKFLLYWIALIIFFNIININVFLLSFLFNLNFLNFISGILISRFIIGFKGVKRYLFLLTLGVIVFIYAWVDVLYLKTLININSLYLISSILIISGLSGIDLNKNIKIPSSLKFLGNASFSIFLTHSLTISVFSKVVDFFGGTEIIHPFRLGLLLMVLSIGIGSIIYIFIEKPAYSYVKNKIYPKLINLSI